MFLVQYWTMKNFILLFIGLIAMARLSAQTIVNTETLMLAGDSGFMWTAGIGGDVSVGNSDVMDVNADAGLTWDWGRTALKVIGSWNSLSEEGESIQGNAFAHIRAEVGDLDRLQVFGFIQSSNNDVLLMTSRNLVGVGLKRSLWSGDRSYGTASWGGFWEAESYSAEFEVSPTELIRNSVVFSGGWHANENLNLRYTVYVQSDVRQWSDSRAFFEWTWDVAIANQMSFEWNLGVRWDGDPHAGLNPVDLGSTVGLRFGFDG